MWHVIGTSVLFFDLALVGYPPSNIFRHIAMEHRSANEAASTLESEITEQLSGCAKEAEINAERKNAHAVERKKARKLADRCTGQEAVNAEQAQKKRLKLGVEQEEGSATKKSCLVLVYFNPPSFQLIQAPWHFIICPRVITC